MRIAAIKDKPIGYLLPVDIPESSTDPEFLKKALRISQFIEWSTAIQVKHALFIFDSCFSGTIFGSRGKESKDEKISPSNYVFSDLPNLPVREFLTSGSENQQVPAESQFVELLMHALLGRRSEADVNKDGFLTGTELIAFITGVVPKYVPTQTPQAGKIRDPSLDQGDIIFKIPGSSNILFQSNSKTDIPNLLPIYRASVGASGSIGIAQIYEVNSLIITENIGCSSNCEGQTKTYSLEVNVPKDFPTNAILDNPELSCIQGDCAKNSFMIMELPKLSEDKRSARVTLQTWSNASTWRLSANVATPASEKSTAVLMDTNTNKTIEVNPDHLSVSGTIPQPAPTLEAELAKVVSDLHSDKYQMRRKAISDLGLLIAKDDSANFTTQLIRGMLTGTYRYQIGVSEALAKLQNGWLTNESASNSILVSAKKSANGQILKRAIQRAIDNQSMFAYYEVGEDGWLTKAGQLKPKGLNRPPLPAPEQLKSGDILEAASEVNLRSGVGTASGIVQILKTNECVRSIKPAKKVEGTLKGLWLQVIKIK